MAILELAALDIFEAYSTPKAIAEPEFNGFKYKSSEVKTAAEATADAAEEAVEETLEVGSGEVAAVVGEESVVENVTEGVSKSNPNITPKISKGGNTITDYTNPSGNKIRTTSQTPSTINQSINKKAVEINPKKVGDFYEGKVGKYIQENTSEEVIWSRG